MSESRKPAKRRRVEQSFYAKTITSGQFPRYELSAEEEIAELISEGSSDQEIADELGILRGWVSRVRKKLKSG